MKTAIKSTLKRLINGPRTEKELTTGDASETAHSVHTLRRLGEAEQQGFCVMIGDLWHLTQSGRDALSANTQQKIKTGRICAGTSTGTYDGSDLRRLANRPGAYDFINVPSLYHFGRVYRKDAQIKDTM